MDERQDDRSRGKPPLSTWLQLGALALTLAAILWRGGQMTEKLDTMAVQVNTVSHQFSTQQIDTATLKVRVDGHDKEIANHEGRISRMEAARVRRDN